MAAVAGTLLYRQLFHPQWDRPGFLLYDIPTLPVVFSFAGAILARFRRGEIRQTLPELISLLTATVLGAGAQFGHWPLSGHLTVALTTGIQEAADRRNSPALRVCALSPVLILVCIRTFCPQTPLMGNAFNTVSALCLGTALGLIALRCKPARSAG